MWRDYDPAEIERDFGYAARLNLNAIRTWLSYEYWLQNPDAHAKHLEHLLDTADKYGMQVLLGLFDSVGRAPTFENLLNDDILAAVQTHSPSGRTMVEKPLWKTPRVFIRWFMQQYRDDDRLLAIELTNEPGWDQRNVQFMREMAEILAWYRGERPLTVGSTSLANNAEYLDWGMDILQFHYNFARTPKLYRHVLQQANYVQTKLDMPVWLSEWQRLRPGEKFAADVNENAAVPDYSSLAPIIHKAGIGNFFWSLMLKPAYTLAVRENGVINGLFHEDGAVWSLDDARAIKAMSGDPSFEGRERKEYPDWTSDIKSSNTPDPGTEQPTRD
ncbi:glycoside hydrolase [Haladaptatus pallidirubidus]